MKYSGIQKWYWHLQVYMNRLKFQSQGLYNPRIQDRKWKRKKKKSTSHQDLTKAYEEVAPGSVNENSEKLLRNYFPPIVS